MDNDDAYKKLKKKAKTFASILTFFFLAGVFEVIILFFVDEYNPLSRIIACLIILTFALSFVSFMISKKYDDEAVGYKKYYEGLEGDRQLERENLIRKSYIEFLESHGCQNAEDTFAYQHRVIWIFDNTFYIAENLSSYINKHKKVIEGTSEIYCSNIDCNRIPIDRIQYYAKEGDVQYTTKISGGGGGGSSISGAIVGGIIAGDAGAVIGSRKKVEEIRSETEVHDTRKTIIRYYQGDSIDTLRFNGYSVYEYLLKYIPQKDLITMQLRR